MSDIYSAMEKAIGTKPAEVATHLATHRMVPIEGKITKEMADGVIRVLMALDLKEDKPITLIISSSGGDVHSGNKIGGMIKTFRSPVDGLVVGSACSMAVDILLMCRRRRMLRHAEIFVHFTRCGFDAVRDSDDITDSDMDAIRRKMTVDKKKREELYMTRLKKTREEVHDLFRIGEKYDTCYTAEEALKLGFVDEIDDDFKFFPTTT